MCLLLDGLHSAPEPVGAASAIKQTSVSLKCFTGDMISSQIYSPDDGVLPHSRACCVDLCRGLPRGCWGFTCGVAERVTDVSQSDQWMRFMPHDTIATF